MQYRNRCGCLVHIAKQYENLLINLACHGWCGSNGICSAFVYIHAAYLAEKPDIDRCMCSYLIGWDLGRRFMLFLRQSAMLINKNK